MKKAKKQGRPPLPKSLRKVYQRLAVYPATYKRIQDNAKAEGKYIVDYIEDVIPKKED